MIAARSTLHGARPAVDAPLASDDATRELSDAELLEIWRDVRKAVAAVEGRLVGGAAGGSSPGAVMPEALAVLAAAPDRIAPLAGLAEVLGLGPTACSALVDRMVIEGWVRRRHAGPDRRIVHVVLTDVGLEHERASTHVQAQQLRVELSVLGAERLTQLRETCRLLRAWDPARAGSDDETLAVPRAARRADLMGLPRPSRARSVGPRPDHG